MKIYKLISAVVVSIAAFFELCLTGRACRAWRMARSDNSVLSSKGPGAGTADFTSIPPRPGIFVSRVTGRVSHSFPPGPALKISRLIGVGKYLAMLAFLVFVLLVVTRPGGLSLTEDGVVYGAIRSASAEATEGQSSNITRKEKIVMIGCLLVSFTLATAAIAIRKESRYGKDRKEKKLFGDKEICL